MLIYYYAPYRRMPWFTFFLHLLSWPILQRSICVDVICYFHYMYFITPVIHASLYISSHASKNSSYNYLLPYFSYICLFKNPCCRRSHYLSLPDMRLLQKVYSKTYKTLFSAISLECISSFSPVSFLLLELLNFVKVITFNSTLAFLHFQNFSSN